MNLKVSLLVALLAGVAASSALADDLQYCDRPGFGDAFRAAVSNQVLNPEASENLRPVVGMDGPAAERVVQSYLKSFTKEGAVAPNIINLGLSPAGSGSSCNK